MAGRKGGAGSGPQGRHNRQEEVLEAAIEVFHEKGYASASIQDVADSVGVLKGSLYHYIDSKEDLLANVFDGSDEQSFLIMGEKADLELPAIERLHAFVRDWALWHLANVERASVYLKEWKHLEGERLARVKERRRTYERFVIGLIDEAKADGAADAALDSRYACYFVLSAINGLPSWYRRRGPDPAARIADIYADMIVAMVRNSPGRPRPAAAKPGRRGR